MLAADPDVALAITEAELIKAIEMPAIGQIVRRKEFMLRPMTEDEAIDQLEFIGS